MLVDLKLQCWKFRQDVRRQACRHDHLQPAPRMGTEEQLAQLITDALGGHNLQPRCHRGHRLEHVWGDDESQLGDKACSAHHAQGIVREGILRRARRAQQRLPEIAHTVMQVDELQTRQAHRHRVDREVPTREITREGVPKNHLRLA